MIAFFEVQGLYEEAVERFKQYDAPDDILDDVKTMLWHYVIFQKRLVENGQIEAEDVERALLEIREYNNALIRHARRYLIRRDGLDDEEDDILTKIKNRRLAKERAK